MTQPLSHSLKLIIKILIKTLNNAGEKELPCRTPLSILKGRDEAKFHLTTTRSFPYQLIRIKIIQIGMPAFMREENSLKW